MNNNSERRIERDVNTLDSNNTKLTLTHSAMLRVLKDGLGELSRTTTEINKEKEYGILIGIGLIGMILLILSKEIIYIYMAIEIYSLTIYALMIPKYNPNTPIYGDTNEGDKGTKGRIIIKYLIISAIATGGLLYGWLKIYKLTGEVDIEKISTIISITQKDIPLEEIKGVFLIIIIAILLKLGTVPYSSIIIRIYPELENKILGYQLTIPKIGYLYLLIKILSLYPYQIYTTTQPFITLTSLSTKEITLLSMLEELKEGLGSEVEEYRIIYILGILTIIVGSIGGIYQTNIKRIIGYSSILNIGYIILTLSLILYGNLINTTNQLGIWTIYNYLIIYIINIIGLISLIIFYTNKYTLSTNKPSIWPTINIYGYLSIIIIVFSLIGIPPLSGFYSKYYLILAIYRESYSSYIAITLIILTTLLSTIYYIKLIYSRPSISSINKFYLWSKSNPTINTTDRYISPQSGSILFGYKKGLKSKCIRREDSGTLTKVISYSTILIIIYPLILSNLIPLLYS